MDAISPYNSAQPGATCVLPFEVSTMTIIPQGDMSILNEPRQLGAVSVSVATATIPRRSTAYHHHVLSRVTWRSKCFCRHGSKPAGQHCAYQHPLWSRAAWSFFCFSFHSDPTTGQHCLSSSFLMYHPRQLGVTSG